MYVMYLYNLWHLYIYGMIQYHSIVLKWNAMYSVSYTIRIYKRLRIWMDNHDTTNVQIDWRTLMNSRNETNYCETDEIPIISIHITMFHPFFHAWIQVTKAFLRHQPPPIKPKAASAIRFILSSKRATWCRDWPSSWSEGSAGGRGLLCFIGKVIANIIPWYTSRWSNTTPGWYWCWVYHSTWSILNFTKTPRDGFMMVVMV